jgi:FkbM family methyltransferase
MRHDINQLTTLINQPINTFAEIGSRDGHDSHYISHYHKINPSNVYIFEAHPTCYLNIKESYPQFNTFNAAITDQTGPVKFNAGIIGKESNVGISSLLNRTTEFNNFISEEVEVDGWKMEDILSHFNLEGFDLLKIDVEGASLSVLKGFGPKLSNSKFIQIELEYTSVWENQSLYQEVTHFLNQLGFVIVEEINLDNVQCDVLFKKIN